MENSKTNISLRALNSFGVEASAARYAEFSDAEQLRAFFVRQRETGEPWYVLSGGNNVLFTRDYPGTILHPVARGVTRLSAGADKVLVRAEAGVEWDDFVAWAVGCGYGGVENLSLIPGYVGAAPVQNIGAYGAEVKDVIREVELYRPDLDRVEVLAGEACAFGYRDSVFKRELRGRAIILSVTFALDLNPVFRLGYGDLNAKVAEAGGRRCSACAMRWSGFAAANFPIRRNWATPAAFSKIPWCRASLRCVCANAVPTCLFTTWMRSV